MLLHSLLSSSGSSFIPPHLLAAAKCTQLSQELTKLQGDAVKQIEALKEGLGREMRRQKVRLHAGRRWMQLRECMCRRVQRQAGLVAPTCCAPARHPCLPTITHEQEVWVAAERAKRETWMADQTRAIKDATVRGLEPEIQVGRARGGGWVVGWQVLGNLGCCISRVAWAACLPGCFTLPHTITPLPTPALRPPQRLVEAHKGELKRAEARHEAEVARRMAGAAAAQEEALAALRAQAANERAAALEAEREVARQQVKDAHGRWVWALERRLLDARSRDRQREKRGEAAAQKAAGRNTSPLPCPAPPCLQV